MASEAIPLQFPTVTTTLNDGRLYNVNISLHDDGPLDLDISGVDQGPNDQEGFYHFTHAETGVAANAAFAEAFEANRNSSGTNPTELVLLAPKEDGPVHKGVFTFIGNQIKLALFEETEEA